MHSINPISNNKIKEITKLHLKKYRDDLGIFLAEGYKILEELVNEKADIVEVISTKNFDKKNLDVKITIVDEKTMKKISTTTSVCNVLTIAKKKKYDIKEFSKLNRIILLDSISDPGNLGTIIRSATAFGIDGIILFGNCVDLYSPKVIRSTAGNLFKLPIIEINDRNEIKKFLKNHKLIATALSKKNNISLKECANIDKTIIMLGSEANGLSKELIDVADKNIRLEMKKDVESLNLAVSASVIFYELFINK